jgi:hypothetical protein
MRRGLIVGARIANQEAKRIMITTIEFIKKKFMRKLKEIASIQIDRSKPKNEITRHFEEILAGRGDEQSRINENRKNYKKSYGQDF